MLDAICLFDESNPVTYSVFKFQKLSERDIEKYRQVLVCPACASKAYYRKASKDGKAACFGSRYHKAACREFKPSAAKEREELHATEVNQLLVDSDAMIIDFSRQPSQSKAIISKSALAKLELDKNRLDKSDPTKEQNSLKAKSTSQSDSRAESKPEHQVTSELGVAGCESQQAVVQGNLRSTEPQAAPEKRIVREGLEKLLHSLMRGSELAESELWVYTDEKYRWRAKNLFVNFADAEPTENGSPRMYWGTVSHIDKQELWLNPADTKDVGIPIDKIAEPLKQRFGLHERRDFEGAAIILFGKCFWNKSKNRKIIQLWSNELNRVFISKSEESE
ncbi:MULTISPECIES: hypothetical protein [unclassified Shewanella]|uniref:hypothetical protein n=1 Tax=unclassified Shewanella TaxID=196818 RepID=UPI001BBB950C|nr:MULTISPECIES: hypothetical protein [unclassified Shewanella]GIU05724.1 hypothetical protein TUM4444_02540 [Shewanella sp. MBTL60-112-B1]GIU25892.1 hypothetical protein TUM4445_04580 [Shewanella sp. MBTL60-112-B2]